MCAGDEQHKRIARVQGLTNQGLGEMSFDIGDQARCFAMAAERCAEQRLSGPDECQSLPLQAAVCWAFSIELGLKALLQREKRDNVRGHSGHSLRELFNGLGQETQESLKRALMESMSLSCVCFDRLLEEHSGIFSEFRYIHEKISEPQNKIDANIKFLRALSEAVLSRV